MIVSMHPNPSSEKDMREFHNFSFLPVTIPYKYQHKRILIKKHGSGLIKNMVVVLNQIPLKAESTNTTV